MSDNTYLVKVLVGLDVFISTLIFRDPLITISSKCGLEMKQPSPKSWAKILNKVLNAIQKDHCNLAIQHDIDRAKAAIEILSK